MASIVVSQGLQRIGINASGLTGSTGVSGTYNGSLTLTRYIQAMSVDDATGVFQAAHTAINGAGGTARTITNSFFANLDAVPIRTNQTVAHLMTIPSVSGNFPIRGIALHDNDNTPALLVGDTTLVAGVDGQALTKTLDFTLAITLSLAYTSV